jgi:predicted NAD-dependent protein-ADP-ribosyltransferase YbiA (DUF1768 family)/serine/threonine protein phosphatase PrpC
MEPYYYFSEDKSVMVYQRSTKGEDAYVFGKGFGICFDGHGGYSPLVKEAVKICCDNFPKLLSLNVKNWMDITRAIDATCVQVDEILKEKEAYTVGATMAGYCIVNDIIYIFWLGDAESIVEFTNGTVTRITEGFQQNTDNPIEIQRLKRDFDNLPFLYDPDKNSINEKRLFSTLNVTGSLGDIQYKKGEEVVNPQLFHRLPQEVKENLKVKKDSEGWLRYTQNIVRNRPEYRIYKADAIKRIMLCSDGIIDHLYENDLMSPWISSLDKEDILISYHQNLHANNQYMDDVTCMIIDITAPETEMHKMSFFHLPDTVENNRFMNEKLVTINPNLPGWLSQISISNVTVPNGGRLVKILEDVYGNPFLFAADFAIYHSSFTTDIPDHIEIEYANHIFSFENSESAFQFGKVFSAKNTDQVIMQVYESLSTSSQDEAYSIGRSINMSPDRWENGVTTNILGLPGLRVTWMEKVVRAKLKNPKIRQLLLSTGNNLLLQIKPGDPAWGSGNGQNGIPGQNLLGKIWMALRDEIRNQ